MKKQLWVHAVVSILFGISAAAIAGTEAAPVMEKCYGIAKAGKNDCDTLNESVCFAQGKHDNAPDALIFVPQGSCDKIVGGSTTPKHK